MFSWTSTYLKYLIHLEEDLGRTEGWHNQGSGCGINGEWCAEIKCSRFDSGPQKDLLARLALGWSTVSCTDVKFPLKGNGGLLCLDWANSVISVEFMLFFLGPGTLVHERQGAPTQPAPRKNQRAESAMSCPGGCNFTCVVTAQCWRNEMCPMWLRRKGTLRSWCLVFSRLLPTCFCLLLFLFSISSWDKC